MKRICACLFIILAVVPLMTSSNRYGTNTAFSTVAFAGHVTGSGGYYCNCDPGPDGVCPCCGINLNNRIMADEPAAHEYGEGPLTQPLPSPDTDQNSDSASGAAALLLLIALIWVRIGA